jgi:hypothetical protein
LKSRWIIGLLFAVVVIGALLWFSPNIISYLQNPTNSSDASYTSLMLRDRMNSTATLEFGDTEYSFTYNYGAGLYASTLYVSTFIGDKSYTPNTGDTYRDFGIEIKVSKITSDYISNYIVFLVKPTVQNYMASLHYTEVNITLNQAVWVNISSGLVNETHQYSFTYTKIVYPAMYEPYITIGSDGQEKTHQVYASGSYAWSTNIRDFNIETTVFKTESQYMLIYVKPLY